jgi:glutamate racemase
VIAILDWGIGGLGFFKLLRERRPGVPVLYLSDAGETPYGKLSAPELASRIGRVAAFLASLGARELVVACNAASTALPALGVSGDEGGLATPAGALRVTGVIAHGVRAALASGARVVGVVGGRRTIRSGVYRRALAREGLKVLQRVAQPLSAYIEAGDLSSPALSGDLARIMAPLRGVEALLLACTHYPAIAPRFREHAPEAALLDPVSEVMRFVEGRWRLAEGGGPDRFLTTGDPAAMRASARGAFGVELAAVEALDRSLSRPPRFAVH